MGFRHLDGLAAALALSVIAAPSIAGEIGNPRGVVELFTSQGCSSCPPADELFAEMAGKGDIVALAYHVDYWDYLGWRDTLAKPENTARQRDYMRTFGSRSVYTPQAVINGTTHVNGSDRAAIETALASGKADAQGLPVPITAKRLGDSLVIEVGEGKTGEKAHVVLVYYNPVTPIAIAEGENRGRTVSYWNAVTDMQTAGVWHAKAARFEMPMSEVTKRGAGGCAVLLQSVGKDDTPGPILGAAAIEYPSGL
ncbi:hypothetical protein MesoLjLc_19540 [Mesorhizobium sp. L-8-10]|uniref:DUF1223 domain-containing protein n=1 Tax=unclassified Mesorhizobium TaxID=325217 RepID=UPI0019280D3D|nr:MULTISPECIES: thioredoxin family protein [unclassified Mesorhizobium]BCH22210.1 hypothetical protein MesoLjLb_19950 [Mesorhizobium sp. L-8-3]BCH30024.1 hypothetical protein MesoLjLc_19540 [Mesorhizobium sp. L-8-10]